ncbi:MAG: hypothetical protein HXY45_02255 [Syntrophaceae bacterium]|nr:hypothetical protein [Syntrophaceae bacterium]
MEIPAQTKAHILIRCPQCGGTIDFLEEAHVIHCQFCGTDLMVAGREGVLRYVLSPRIEDEKKARALAVEHLLKSGKRSPRTEGAFLFYAAFWRMQGTVYRWVFGLRPMKVQVEAGVPPPMERFKVLLFRVMDHTVPGYSGLDLGLGNLGVRPQAMRLQPFSPEHLEKRGSFLPLEIPLEKVQAESERWADYFFQAENLVSEVDLQKIVGLCFSVLYSPLWYLDCSHDGGREILLLDAVGLNPVQNIPDGSPILSKLRGTESRKSFQFSELGFLPFRCPNCGWALPFRPSSLMHFCPTCRRLFREKGGEWSEMSYSIASPSEGGPEKGPLWVPFWRFRTRLESPGETLETMADLYRLAPPPRVVDIKRESGRPIYFYIPAVKFKNPQTIHNLGSRLTFLQPKESFGRFEDGSHPLTAGGSLGEEEAREMGLIILGSLIPQANRKARAWLQQCRVNLESDRLVYFPFSRADLFW